MITQILIVPEDAKSETFAIRDQLGNHLSDANSIGEACEIAAEIAEHAGIDRLTVLLSQHA